jgi:hypothetical protein
MGRMFSKLSATQLSCVISFSLLMCVSRNMQTFAKIGETLGRHPPLTPQEAERLSQPCRFSHGAFGDNNKFKISHAAISNPFPNFLWIPHLPWTISRPQSPLRPSACKHSFAVQQAHSSFKLADVPFDPSQ